MKVRTEVARGVIWRCSVVWGERGRGMERWWGCRVGVAVDVDVVESGICAARGVGGAFMMRGILLENETFNVSK